jgi:hypothetical protein
LLITIGPRGHSERYTKVTAERMFARDICVADITMQLPGLKQEYKSLAGAKRMFNMGT